MAVVELQYGTRENFTDGFSSPAQRCSSHLNTISPILFIEKSSDFIKVNDINQCRFVNKKLTISMKRYNLEIILRCSAPRWRLLTVFLQIFCSSAALCTAQKVRSTIIFVDKSLSLSSKVQRTEIFVLNN